MASALFSCGWTIVRGVQARRRRRAVQRARRQHREAVPLGDELQDRRHGVDLHRDLRPQAQAGEARLDQRADRVRPAGNDQREARQVAQAQRPRLACPPCAAPMRQSGSSSSIRISIAGDAVGL